MGHDSSTAKLGISSLHQNRTTDRRRLTSYGYNVLAGILGYVEKEPKRFLAVMVELVGRLKREVAIVFVL
jgi:hypothetical protein